MMADLVIGDPIAQRLQEIAVQEKRTIEDVLNAMLEKYSRQPSNTEALRAMDGMFDDDVTDLSSITRDDVMELYRKKYADPR